MRLSVNKMISYSPSLSNGKKIIFKLLDFALWKHAHTCEGRNHLFTDSTGIKLKFLFFKFCSDRGEVRANSIETKEFFIMMIMNFFMLCWRRKTKMFSSDNSDTTATSTTWKVSVFGIFLVSIFPHGVFSPNVGKYGPEKHHIYNSKSLWVHYWNHSDPACYFF